jgi:hypothetical protein
MKEVAREFRAPRFSQAFGESRRRRDQPRDRRIRKRSGDILVVGSALFIKGHDMGREIRLIRALADEGYQSLNGGVPPIPRDGWCLHLPPAPGPGSWRRSSGGVPVVMPGGGQINRTASAITTCCAGSAEAIVTERQLARAAHEREASAWREAFIAEHGVIPPPSQP